MTNLEKLNILCEGIGNLYSVIYSSDIPSPTVSEYKYFHKICNNSMNTIQNSILPIICKHCLVETYNKIKYCKFDTSYKFVNNDLTDSESDELINKLIDKLDLLRIEIIQADVKFFKPINSNSEECHKKILKFLNIINKDILLKLK